MDRNFGLLPEELVPCVSLSARRAWIEIPAYGSAGINNAVALRKESVDRNVIGQVKTEVIIVASLSARRAWIEICPLSWGGGYNLCRSPQGERG